MSYNPPTGDLTELLPAARKILPALSQVGEKLSEDCLTLNVWAKPSGQKNRAILLWFYGGGKLQNDGLSYWINDVG
jgi:carboxylesterase type B